MSWWGVGGYRYTRGLAYLMRGEATLASEDFAYASSSAGDPEVQLRSSEALHALEDWQQAAIGPLGSVSDGSSKELAQKVQERISLHRLSPKGGRNH